MIKHSPSTQSNKFSISLQYIKKEVKDRVSFLHADKHQSFHNFHRFSVWQLLLSYIMMQNMLISYKGQVMFVVTFSKIFLA